MKKIISFLKYYYHTSQYFKNILIKRWNNENNQHKIKEKAIIEYSDKYHNKIFIETGTYLGEMVYALRNKFDTLYTIELSLYLFKTSKKRFSDCKNINFLLGDSGIELAKVVTQITNPAIFWLDGHYSGGITEKGKLETPILKELQSICTSPYSHVILIDDARCFGNPEFPDYPSIQELKDYILKLKYRSNFEIKDDIIRIIPQ